MQVHSISGAERTRASLLVAAAIAVGLGFPAVATALAPAVFIALFFVVLFSLSNLDDRPSEIVSSFDSLTWHIVMWQMLFLPAGVTIACYTLNVAPIFVMILLATVTAGSVFASPALVQIVGLDHRLATRAMVLSTLMAPASLLLFGEINGILPGRISLQHYGQQIAIYILLPIAIAIAFRRFRVTWSQQAKARTSRMMHWGATLALMVFCAGIMTTINDSIGHDFSRVVSYAGIALAASVIMFTVTALLFAGRGKKEAVTAGMLSANRNVAISFVLLNDVFPPEMMVYVAVSQFPIFLMPLLIRTMQVGRHNSVLNV